MVEVSERIANDYDPNPKQWRYHTAPVRHKLYGGSMGGGKSRALCEEVHQLCMQFPGINAGVGRENLPELRRTTLDTYLNETLCGEFSTYWDNVIRGFNRTYQELYYQNGSKVFFLPLSNDPRSQEKIKSTKFAVFAIDEATEVSETLVNMIDTRMRQPIPNVPRSNWSRIYRTLYASNPEPGWVKKRFIRETPLEDHIFVPALWRDNADHLPPDYDKAFRFMPEILRKRYEEGSWDVFEGMIYTDFDPKVHLIDPFDILEEWPRWRSMDYGYTNPQAILWFAMDWEGNVCLYDEAYERAKSVSWWKNTIAVKSGSQKYRDTFGCPKFFQTESDGRTVADEYEEGENRIFISQAPMGVSVRIMRVMEFLKVNPERKHPITGEMGSPRLFFLKGRCPNTIQELQEYAWKDRTYDEDETQREEAQDRKNHAMEALERCVGMIYEIDKPVEERKLGVVETRMKARYEAIHAGKPLRRQR